MDNILYKTFGKRVYKAILNLIGSGGGNSGGSNVSGDIKMLAVNILGNDLLTDTKGYLYTKLDLSDMPQDLPDDIVEQIDMVKQAIEVNNEIIKFIIDTINDNKIPIVYIKTSYDATGIIMRLYDYIEFPVISDEDDGGGGPIKKVNEKASNTKGSELETNITLRQDGMAHSNTYIIKAKIVDNKLKADEVVSTPREH